MTKDEDKTLKTHTSLPTKFPSFSSSSSSSGASIAMFYYRVFKFQEGCRIANNRVRARARALSTSRTSRASRASYSKTLGPVPVSKRDDAISHSLTHSLSLYSVSIHKIPFPYSLPYDIDVFVFPPLWSGLV